MEKSKLETFCDHIEKWTLNITIGICVVMLVVAWMHVIKRYVFNDALTWSEEFLRFAIVWYALLSAGLLHKKNGHLGITIFRDSMPAKLREFLRRVVIYLGTLTVALVAVFGVILTVYSWPQSTPALRISVSWPYASIPVSFFLMTLYGFTHILRDLKGLPPVNAENGES
jgi:TRAP-type C4-dicarboxylate transport system permease small subunit